MYVKPFNRYVQVKLEEPKEESQSSVILPDDYKTPESEHVLVTLVSATEDSVLAQNSYLYPPLKTKLVIPRHMIQEIDLGEETIYLIQENYIMAIVT